MECLVSFTTENHQTINEEGTTAFAIRSRDYKDAQCVVITYESADARDSGDAVWEWLPR